MNEKLKQELFNYLADNHDVELMEDDFNSIEYILSKHKQANSLPSGEDRSCMYCEKKIKRGEAIILCKECTE